MPGTKQSGGRKTPTAILNKRGSWRGKERAKTEPKFDPAAPKPPAELKGKAKRTWNEMVHLLNEAGMLTKVDGKALARYCKYWAEWCALMDFDDTKIVIGSVKDLEIVHKHLDKTLKISDALLKFEIQYGMTPASRPNVKRLEKPAHGNSADRFFQTG